MTAYTFDAVTKKKGQCLTIVDELPSMGYNPTFEVMLAVARSKGQSFIGVAQNIELMKLHYPNSYKSFIGEADFVLWMGGNHPDNAQFLSQRLGKKTIVKTISILSPIHKCFTKIHKLYCSCRWINLIMEVY